MGIFEIIVALAIGAAGYHIHCVFEAKDREISDLKEELRRASREIESKQSSSEWANGAYDRLLKNYYEVLEKYNIPVNWKSLEEEECEVDEDDEDEQMVEVTTIGKDGTRTTKVPAIHVSFKESYYNEIKKKGGNK